MPTKEQWEEEQLHQYGLIAVDSAGNATQLEKVTYDVAMAFLPKDVQQVQRRRCGAGCRVGGGKRWGWGGCGRWR